MNLEDGNRRPTHRPLDDSFLFADPMDIGGAVGDGGIHEWAELEFARPGCPRLGERLLARGISAPGLVAVAVAAVLGVLAGAAAPVTGDGTPPADPSLMACPRVHSSAPVPAAAGQEKAKVLIQG